MKIKNLFFAALATLTLASCVSDEFVGESPATQTKGDGSINFAFQLPNATRANEFVGATAAEKLGGMFVVEGTKGTEAEDAPSSTVVFDNYLVGYGYNTAGTTESNTNNWEYVGLESGIADRMTSATWTALHTGDGTAQSQTIKYWDYSVPQYDFIAWSTGQRLAIASGDAEAGVSVKVTRINKGTTLASNGFTLTAANAADLLQCYYTDINTVTKASTNYGKPVTLTFRNMAAKVRVALYETVPGYSVKAVQFYTSDATPTAPTDLAYTKGIDATLFTMGEDVLPQSGAVTVCYPRIGSDNSGKDDYNKASVSVTPGSSTSTTVAFGELSDQYTGKEGSEAAGNIYLGRDITKATFAGDKTKDFYTAVVPNTNGKPLTLRLNYTLVATDGSGEEIKVYGAKAVVPATYTKWLPNYAYTYIFKISDNTNGYTSQTNTDPTGLFPITFDAVVTDFVDTNDEQATVTTVATPSITTYQQGHDHENKDEYSKSQTAGVSSDKKALYVMVMDNGGATPSLKADLNGDGKSLLFKVTGSTPISEATVMDALQNHTADYVYNAASPVGRNGLTLTASGEISNTATSIVNGVDDQPITGFSAGQLAEIDIKDLTTGTYAYVYCTTVPTADERVYHVVSPTTAAGAPTLYYEVNPASLVAAADAKAVANKVYFIENLDANGNSLSPKSYTFVQTKVGVTSVSGLYEATIVPATKASDYTAGRFYFDVYNQNNGAYAVKVIKVVD